MEAKVKVKVKPRAAPVGHKQAKCRILPDHLLHNVKKQNSALTAANDHTKQLPQSSCQGLQKQYFASAVSQV